MSGQIEANGSTTAPPLTLAQALRVALALQRKDRFDDAEALYGKILQAEPDCVDALHFLGVLHSQTGRPARAIDLIRQAIALDPKQAQCHNNLGNVLVEQNKPREAAKAFKAAIRLDPANADALSNLGVCHRKLGRLAEAEASFRRAIACSSTHGAACNNLGQLLLAAGRYPEAIRMHAQALEGAAPTPDSRRFIVSAYVASGDLPRALQVARQWADEEPRSATARHMLAAISGQNVPPRASDAFIEIAFDRFAASFDTKLELLEYRAPQLVAEAVRKACGPVLAQHTVLDAGCGTGLCGPLLAPHAATLAGVDLSGKMLDQARARGCYTSLVKAELTQHLRDNRGQFDVIVSADTLCYFGDLHDVAVAAAGALRPEGVLVFSVEAEAASGPYRLNPHGRYSHHRDHVAGAMAAAGLRISAIEEAVLRRESLKAVAGFVVTAHRPPATSAAAAAGPA